MGHVNGMRLRGCATFLIKHRHVNGDRLHVAVIITVAITGGIGRIKFQRINGRAQAGGHRVGPRHIFVEPDGDAVGGVQTDTHHIQFTGDGGVDHVKT